MARGTGNEATVAEAEAPKQELTAEEQAKADAKKEQRKARRAQRTYVVVPMPANLKSVFEEEAKNADKAIGPYVRDFLAQVKGIEIPVTVTTRRVKYANDEERDAAKKARRESRSSTMKALLAHFNQLTKGGMSAEQATAQAAANVANGVSPEAQPAAA